ncbi:RND family transporter [Methyloceanibacter sp. wino2]|uniref:efflux RND transporter permease subunit n=1 Tax=Methyloceanibacter sp. wino2 TaxID=2170729 RepID=UPI00131EDBCB|nr:MMPL family transporter [Methyloceanibacter sp. wino2]
MTSTNGLPPQIRLYRYTKPFVLLGEVTLRYPRRALAILVLLTLIVGAGLFRVEADDALDRFLQSSTPDYQAFEALRERFPASDLDVYLAVDGRDLLSSEHLGQMQDIAFDLLLLDSVDTIVSIFALREPLASDRLPAPIIPDDLSDDDQLADLGTLLDGHPLASGRLISKSVDGRRLALFVVALNREQVSSRGLPNIVRELDSAIAQSAAGSDLRLGLSGMPVMKAEVIESTRRDILVFNAIGLVVGALILAIFFRRWQLVMIAIAPALLAVLWCLGLFGWTGTRIDPLMNAVMPLVLVVALNNGMHFLYAICRNLDAGAPKVSAIRQSLAEVGPACALTSITTSIALLSMALSNSELIRSFGIMAALSVLLALAIVMAVMPMLAMVFLKEGKSKYLSGGRARKGAQLLENLSVRLSTSVAKKPNIIAVSGLVLTMVFAWAYLQLEPRFRLSDMLPDQGTAVPVLDRIEDRLGGLFPLSALVQWPEQLDYQSDEVRSAIQDIHETLQGHPGISKVNSLYDLQVWAESGGLSPSAAIERLNEAAPPEVISRFVNADRHAALVSGYINDLEANDILKLSSELDSELDGVRVRHPGFTITLTGLASVGATRSTAIISQLSLSMLGAVIIVIALIGMAFRSILFAGLSVIPNLFALFATGTWLMLLQGGLDYATIVGLTVAFGLAVDDTIHVLNRYEIEVQRSGDASIAVEDTMRIIGTVLILTTVALLAGISVTQLSVVPPTRQFGLICMSTLIFALLGDLVILPALILVASRWKNWPLRPEPVETTDFDRGQPDEELHAWKVKG